MIGGTLRRCVFKGGEGVEVLILRGAELVFGASRKRGRKNVISWASFFGGVISGRE